MADQVHPVTNRRYDADVGHHVQGNQLSRADTSVDVANGGVVQGAILAVDAPNQFVHLAPTTTRRKNMQHGNTCTSIVEAQSIQHPPCVTTSGTSAPLFETAHRSE